MNAKLKKISANVLAVLFAISAFLIFGFIAIIVPATSNSFYKSQFEKHDTLSYVRYQARYLNDENAKVYIENLTFDELLSLMNHTMRYCLFLEDDLNITVDGQYLEIFLDEKGETLNDGCLERTHMADVKALFGGGMIIIMVAILIVIIGIVLGIKHREYYYENCRKTPYITLFVVFILLAAIGIFVAVNFDTAFTMFHKIFFDGKQWQFGYGVMIAMIGEIFLDLVPIIVSVWVGLLAVFIVGLILFNKHQHKKL